MSLTRTPAVLLSALAGLSSCAAPSSFRVDPVIGDCVTKDVVFFGELHDNAACHAQQLALLKALHAQRKDVVVSMEMFERDVQDLVDKFLASEIDEPSFRTKARAWKNWESYRDVVRYAAANHIPVLAANAPLELVRKVSRGGGVASVAGAKFVAREISAPRDEYFEDFVVRMTDANHFADVQIKPWMERFYEAQCVRDDTMAETITDYLAAAHAKGRHPVVLHMCGALHSAKRRGTVARVLRRMPGLQVRVITTSDDLYFYSRGASGDFELLVPKSKSETKPGAKHPAGPTKSTAKHPSVPGKSTAKSTAKPTAKAPPTAEQPPSGARPGLGFKPAYESDAVGVEVELVVEGSAADKAGIKRGDVIRKLAGQEIDDVRRYSDVLGGLKIGQSIEVEFEREGKRLKVPVVVGESHR
ncbi:MAG: ChaN family lipoprotein [Planctomycetes bacterium]|nr:ChaN family lipoprotein [Planctomycetota bacterium]MCB9889048.1 ChaN family lipoprotein [Planctomycetota bacterium]